MEDVKTEDLTNEEFSKLSIHRASKNNPTPEKGKNVPSIKAVSCTSLNHDIDLDAEVDLDSLSVDYDSFDEHSYERPAERWAPLGAAVSPTPSPIEPK